MGPQTDTYDDLARQIQDHRTRIVRAQQDVLARRIDMPTYNGIYKEQLAAIHALEERIRGLGHPH